MPSAKSRQVVILHGWSDSSESFEPLVAFLRKNGFKAVPLWLGDYISMDDDVRIEDVAKRLEAAVRKRMAVAADPLVAPFDMIVHSTGGLVARQWIASYHGSAPAACPAKRVVMLAPANFGSPLASKGKSFLGRVVKGFRNWFHTGREMLDSLELASAFQWNLARRDLLIAPEDVNRTLFYGGEGVWPFVIVGLHPARWAAAGRASGPRSLCRVRCARG
jgi:pimeloyl-ACP methyl ester carboxylesterase